MSLVDEAMRLADTYGWAVFPIKVGEEKPDGKRDKFFLGFKWQDNASNIEADIYEMPWAEATHVAINCKLSGIWVVDVDDPLATNLIDLPPTMTQDTMRKGGRHYIYQAGFNHQPCGTGIPVTGMDIRSDGGCIVWYGLAGDLGHDISPWPWKDSFSSRRTTKENAGKARDNLKTHYGPGERNNGIFLEGICLLDKWPSITIDMMYAALIGLNRLYCRPPMDDGEVRKIAISVMTQAEEQVDLDSDNLFVSAEVFLKHELDCEWFVEDWIEEGDIGQIFGPSTEGKTFLAIDVACACAIGGTTFGGCEVTKGQVLYIAGEGHRGIERRIRGWKLKNGCSDEDLHSLHVSPKTIPFTEAGLGAIIEAGTRRRDLTGQPIKLIVIDTLAQHLIGDENSNEEMGKFIKACAKINSAFPGCTTLIIHHTGLTDLGRSRGASCLKASLEFELQCNKQLLSVTKSKEGVKGRNVEIALIPIHVGFTRKGKPITTCTVEYGGKDVDISKREHKLSQKQEYVLNLVGEMNGDLIGDIQDAYAKDKEKGRPNALWKDLRKECKGAIAELEKLGKVKYGGENNFNIFIII